MLEKITDNKQKIKQNKVLPYLVGNIVEVSFLLPFPPLHLPSIALVSQLTTQSLPSHLDPRYRRRGGGRWSGRERGQQEEREECRHQDVHSSSTSHLGHIPSLLQLESSSTSSSLAHHPQRLPFLRSRPSSFLSSDLSPRRSSSRETSSESTRTLTSFSTPYLLVSPTTSSPLAPTASGSPQS
jgi:hypothetical protein